MCALVDAIPIFTLSFVITFFLINICICIADTLTVEEAIEKMGFGPFQILITFFCGFIWVSVCLFACCSTYSFFY